MLSPILVLTNQLCLGGAENYVVTVTRWLAERGVQVALAATPGELVDRLHPAVRYEPIPLSDLRWSIPVAATRVRRLIRELRPRAIVTNSLVTSWVATLAQAGLDLPVVNVAHGWPVERYRLVARPMRIADAVVAVSPLVKRHLVDHGLPAEKVHVVYNGIDLTPYGPLSPAAREAARAAFGAGPDDLVVANIGRFTEQKAQQHVVAVARALRLRFPRLRYGVIGWGEREAELGAMIEEAELGDHVRLLTSRRDVPDLLRAADVYLNCSNWEGMPLSTIEGMAAGLPIVATATEGVPELLTDENAFVVPVGDTAAMAEVIGRLAGDDVLRRRMGRASRQRAERHFDRHAMCEGLAAVIREVAGG